MTILVLGGLCLGTQAMAEQHDSAVEVGMPEGMHHDHPHHHGMMAGHWMAPAKEAKRRNPVKPDKTSLARGKKLYPAHCASCHGEGGEGNGPAAEYLQPKPANLKEMAPQHADGDLAWKIAQGRGAMPAWKGTLKPQQIWDLVNYIKRLGHS